MEYTLKKSLGQHFLHDETICKQIVDALDTSIQKLIEIGPGGGALTKYLLQTPFEEFKCIELDTEKVIWLIKHFPSLQDRIENIDFLLAEKPYEGDFAVIGNFPYNISTQIVFKILDWKENVSDVVGMFQKEVAQRIASKHGNKDYGILSVLTQCYYEVEYLFDVPASCFTPPPNVVSGVLRMKRNNNPYQIENYDKFRRFVKAAFSQRRKTLRNSLKSYLPADKLQGDVFSKRAEQLSVLEFVDLYNQTKS